MRLSEFDYELAYRPGSQMHVADCLSRNPLPQEISADDVAGLSLQGSEESKTGLVCLVQQIPSDNETGSLFEVAFCASTEGAPPSSSSTLAVESALMTDMCPSGSVSKEEI